MSTATPAPAATAAPKSKWAAVFVHNLSVGRMVIYHTPQSESPTGKTVYPEGARMQFEPFSGGTSRTGATGDFVQSIIDNSAEISAALAEMRPLCVAANSLAKGGVPMQAAWCVLVDSAGAKHTVNLGLVDLVRAVAARYEGKPITVDSKPAVAGASGVAVRSENGNAITGTLGLISVKSSKGTEWRTVPPRVDSASAVADYVADASEVAPEAPIPDFSL
jgi:hypothetical protein